MENQLENVDLAVMHGMFEHQCPPGIKLPTHTASRYEAIVNRKVLIGHIHQASARGKIMAPGSFDRLCHGDEGKKGHWRMTLNPNPSQDTITFVENKMAMTYLTVDCRGLSFDVAVEKLTAKLVVPIGSHIRILVKAADPTAAILEWGKKQFTDLHWTSKRKDDVADGEAGDYGNGVVVVKHEAIALTSTTLPDLVKTKVSNMQLDPLTQQRTLALLDTLLGNKDTVVDTDVEF